MAAYAARRLRQLRHGRPLRQRRGHHRPLLDARAAGRSADAAHGLHQVVPGARADDARTSCAPASQRSARPPAASTRIDLLQLHWWTFEHPGYIDAMRELAALREEGLIRHLGAHQFRHRPPAAARAARHSGRLQPGLASRCSTGAPPSDMSDVLPRDTACGCSPTARSAAASSPSAGSGAPEPRRASPTGARSKYKRFIDAIGGWDALQGVLARARARSRDRHGVSVANVATRWVLDQPAVAAVIVGARLGEREHRADNLPLFSLRARRRRPRARSTRLSPRTAPDPRRLRRRVPPPALPHRVRRSQPSPGELPAGLSRRCRCRAGPAAPRVDTRQRLGADLRLQPRGARRRPHPGQRHHGDARRGRSDLPRRSRAAQAVYILDKIAASLARARRLPRRRGAHARLPARRRRLGAGLARARPLSSATSGRPTRCSRSRASSATTRSRSRPRRWSDRASCGKVGTGYQAFNDAQGIAEASDSIRKLDSFFGPMP